MSVLLNMISGLHTDHATGSDHTTPAVGAAENHTRAHEKIPQSTMRQLYRPR